MVKKNEKNGDPASSTEWEEFASFVIEFQRLSPNSGQTNNHSNRFRTLVHHMENAQWASWPGIELSELLQWIETQADEAKTQNAPPSLPSPTQASDADESGIAIRYIRVYEAAERQAVSRPGSSFFGVITAESPLTIEISVDVTGENKLNFVAANNILNFSIKLTRADTQQAVSLGPIAPIQTRKNKTTYLASVNSIRLASGIYKLSGVVTLSSSPMTTENIGPSLLQVV